MISLFTYILTRTRCWIGKHTFPLYANKFISIDPWHPEDGGYGYRAQCFVCGKVKESWVYDSSNDYLTPPSSRAKAMQDDFKSLPDLKLTEEIK